jgi:hypothetical protein
MITVYNRDNYDCCTAVFEDEKSRIRIHFHKADSYGVSIRQLLLDGDAGTVISQDFVPPGNEVECDAWR